MAEAGEPPGEQHCQAPGRRAFLQFAAAAGGASLLSACSSNGSASTAISSTGAVAPRHPRVARRCPRGPGPPRPAEGRRWAALARDLSGPLIRPGESGYSTAKELFDPRFDSLHPAGIAYCRNPHDVATSLAFVRKYGLPVAARCGGHSYAGWSSTKGRSWT